VEPADRVKMRRQIPSDLHFRKTHCLRLCYLPLVTWGPCTNAFNSSGTRRVLTWVRVPRDQFVRLDAIAARPKSYTSSGYQNFPDSGPSSPGIAFKILKDRIAELLSEATEVLKARCIFADRVKKVEYKGSNIV